MTSTTRRLIRQKHTGAIPLTPPPIPGATMLAPGPSRRVDPSVLWPFLFVFILAVALAFVVGMLNRPAERPASVAPVVTVVPAALAAPLPLPTVTLMTPARQRVTTDRLPAVCGDGKTERGYSVPDVAALTEILTRHAGRCRVGGGAGWTAEAQQEWYETHKE